MLCVKRNQQDSFVVTAGEDKSVFAWDPRAQKPINYILAHSSAVTSVDISDDSSVCLTTSDEGYS